MRKQTALIIHGNSINLVRSVLLQILQILEAEMGVVLLAERLLALLGITLDQGLGQIL